MSDYLFDMFFCVENHESHNKSDYLSLFPLGTSFEKRNKKLFKYDKICKLEKSE